MELSYSVAQQIVERITTSLGVQCSIADPSSQVLACSNHTHAIDRAVGDLAVQPNNGSHLADKDVALPLLYADTAIGKIVLHGDGLRSTQLAPLAKALAELIVHQTSLLEQLMHQHWARDRFIFNLLHGSFNAAPDVVQREAALLGIDLDLPRIVVIVDTPATSDAEADHTAVAPAQIPHSYPSHLLEHARRVIHRHAQDSYSWCGARWLIVLAVVDPLTIETDHHGLVASVQRLLDTLNTGIGAPASAGVGRYYAGWSALPHSFADAQFALKLGTQIRGPGRVFLPKDLGLASFVCHDDAALKTELAQRLLQPVLDKADLLATLEAFLGANLSSSQTAQTLCIHRHTLDYRLNKIAQLTGLDPRHFDAAAQLLAALLWLGMERVNPPRP